MRDVEFFQRENAKMFTRAVNAEQLLKLKDEECRLLRESLAEARANQTQSIRAIELAPNQIRGIAA